MISLISKNIFIVWLRLEIKMFGVIPFLNLQGEKTKKVIFLSKREIKVRFFYFFIQVIGSLFFAWGTIIRKWYVIGILGLAIKIGIVPFFWWVPPLLTRLDWVSIGLLRTIQKVPGILVLRLVFDLRLDIAILLRLLGFMVARVGINFSYNKIKALISWSSISNMRMLFLLIILNRRLGVIYYLFYSFLVFAFCTLLQIAETKFISNSFLRGNKINRLGIIKFLLLVFSGLPPFIRFLIKLYFLSGIYLFDISLIISDMEFKNRNISFFYLLGRFLKRWKIVLSFTLLIIVQSIGYIKAFIKINSSSSSRLRAASLIIKKHGWIFYSFFGFIYISRLLVVWV